MVTEVPIPETRFAVLGDDRIADQVFGEGDVDLIVAAIGECLDLNWDSGRPSPPSRTRSVHNREETPTSRNALQLVFALIGKSEHRSSDKVCHGSGYQHFVRSG